MYKKQQQHIYKMVDIFCHVTGKHMYNFSIIELKNFGTRALF